MPRSADILLVQPPVQHPAFFAPDILKAAAVLRAKGRKTACFHAGIDFSVNYLMADRVQANLLAHIQERRQKGAYQGADGEIFRWLEGYAAPQASTSEELTSACSDPCKTAHSLYRLDKTLRLASVAYYPTHLDRRGFSHPALDEETELSGYLEDPVQNPFWEYARHGCRPSVSIDQCEVVIFVVSTPGQMAGALTLARCWKRKHPSTGLSVCASQDHLRAGAERLLAVISEPAVLKLADMVQEAISKTGMFPEETSIGDAAGVEVSQGKLRQQILTCPLRPEPMQSLLASLGQGGGSVIVWHQPQGALASVSPLLFQSAKQACA